MDKGAPKPDTLSFDSGAPVPPSAATEVSRHSGGDFIGPTQPVDTRWPRPVRLAILIIGAVLAWALVIGAIVLIF